MNVLLSVVALSAAVVSATPSLKLNVVAPLHIVNIHGLVVRSTLTNTGNEALKIINSPNSVLSAYDTDPFVISSTRGGPAFAGIRVKWSPAAAAASGSDDVFTVLAPGQQVEKVKLTAKSVFELVNPSGALQSIRAETDSRQFQLAGLLAAPNAAAARKLKRDKFVGCNKDQQTTIFAASTPTSTSAADPLTNVHIRHGLAPQTTSESRLLLRILRRLESKRRAMITIVYLCPQFWEAPMVGVDSKAGTIVHENSHFYQNGGTEDHEYGQTGCKDLAKNDPDKAIRNADSHEYFVEGLPPSASM
ncbi:peptidyl-Lys metalloendopeptidase [Ceratobasidium sp. AG-Ba]|nr:peptidyl-Lys metalloendopeptidase [Ceratobasidium sp. AG-Ba]